MTHDPQTIAWLDQEDAHLAQVIRAHRWSVQFVGAGDEADEPPFGYTVGLFGLGHPELVLVGLGPKTTHSVLGRVAGVVADGWNLVAEPGRGGARRQPLLRTARRVLRAGVSADVGVPGSLLSLGG